MTLRLVLSEDTESRFREKAMKKFGYRKGAIAEALAEAVTDWLDHQTPDIPLIEDPVSALEGLLANVRESSVELQHLGSKLFIGGEV